MDGKFEKRVLELDVSGSGLIPIQGNFPWTKTADTTKLYAFTDWGSIPAISLPIAGLLTPQRNLDRLRLFHHLAHRIDEPVRIAETQDGLMIVDGHHRMAVLWMKGHTEVVAKVVGFSQ